MAAEQLTIALDANGADAGPATVARGAALAAASGDVRVLVFGPADEIDRPDAGRRLRPRAGTHRGATAFADGVELVDAPVSIAKAADPARAGSAALAIETGASTTFTPAPGAPICAAGPKTSTRISPSAAASAAPRATSAGPASAPLASSAIVSCSAAIAAAA